MYCFRLSGDVGNAEFTAQHESLLEACAQMSDAKSGGSLTAIGVVDFANTGLCGSVWGSIQVSCFFVSEYPGSASSAADRRRNATMKNVSGHASISFAFLVCECCCSPQLVSLADNRVVLSSKEARKGVLLPLDPEDIAARTGHASQGPAMCYYVNAAKLQYLQVSLWQRYVTMVQAAGVNGWLCSCKKSPPTRLPRKRMALTLKLIRMRHWMRSQSSTCYCSRRLACWHDCNTLTPWKAVRRSP